MLRRRRILTILVLFMLGAAWLAFSLANTTRQMQTGFGGGSTVELEGKKRTPLTLTVSPGRMTAPPPVDVDETPTATSNINRENFRRLVSERPVALGFYLSFVLPLVLLFGLAWLLSRARSVRGYDEVNYGIFKGAMPLEMITASYRHIIITTRQIDASPFGKDQRDYIPASTRLPEATLAWQDNEAI
ncbi:MAG TPA: hypothetical protein VNZ52_05580 [Candidatus Thermoplasmatota archaeon]|nr:hypothetical protein [Candidatus Thermoplasmatota archaeon]